MKISTYTIEGSELQTTYLLHALGRAKEVATKFKKSIGVFLDGQPYCTVAKSGKVSIN